MPCPALKCPAPPRPVLPCPAPPRAAFLCVLDVCFWLSFLPATFHAPHLTCGSLTKTLPVHLLHPSHLPEDPSSPASCPATCPTTADANPSSTLKLEVRKPTLWRLKPGLPFSVQVQCQCRHDARKRRQSWIHAPPQPPTPLHPPSLLISASATGKLGLTTSFSLITPNTA